MNEYFNTRFRHSEIKEKIWKELAEYFQKNIPIKPHDTVLDLGAGYCYFINNIRCKEKHALDICPIPLNNAQQDVIKHVRSCTNLKIFKTKFFDVVFCSNLLEHLDVCTIPPHMLHLIERL